MNELQGSKDNKQGSEQDQLIVVQERANRTHNILKSLRVVFRSIQAHSRQVEKESAVSSTQLWMLWEIFNVSGMKVTKLAETLSIHQSTCSNILDKLQQKGMIKRERSGADQRVVNLHLTEKGTKLLAKAPRPAQGAISAVLQKLPDEVLVNMETSLTHLIGALQVTEKDAALKPLDL